MQLILFPAFANADLQDAALCWGGGWEYIRCQQREYVFKAACESDLTKQTKTQGLDSFPASILCGIAEALMT